MVTPWVGGASYIFETTKETLLQLNFSNKVLFTFQHSGIFFLALHNACAVESLGRKDLLNLIAQVSLISFSWIYYVRFFSKLWIN